MYSDSFFSNMGDSVKRELLRTADMLVDIAKNQGVYFSVAFLHDSQTYSDRMPDFLDVFEGTRGASFSDSEIDVSLDDSDLSQMADSIVSIYQSAGMYPVVKALSDSGVTSNTLRALLPHLEHTEGAIIRKNVA